MSGDAATLLAAVRARRTAVAFRCGEDVATYADLDDRSRGLSGVLRELGVGRGARVASWLPSGLECVVVLVAVHRLGAALVPVNLRYRVEELAHVLEDASPTVLVTRTDGEAADVLAGLPVSVGAIPRIVVGDGPIRLGDRGFDEVPGAAAPDEVSTADEDIALVVYTSGTTGRSKGVELSFRALVRNIEALTRLWEFSERDRLVLALPLFHVHGLCIGVVGTLLRGCSATVIPRFSPAAVADALRVGGTVFMGVPTMYALLAEAMEADPSIAEALASARLLTSGSAPLSTALFERIERATGQRILERYGMTETLLTLSNPYRGERRPGTVGQPVPGCEVRIVDDDGVDVGAGEVGELWVRGDSLMSGYRLQPEQTAAALRDGWFMTGDAASRSDDGYVTIVGRRSTDIVKSGGFKVSTREIEEVLERHASVLEVAVVGVPDSVWGERIGAAVVPVSGADRDRLPAVLAAHVAGTLADYKRLRAVVLLDALPRNSMGKVDKRLLASSSDWRSV